MRKKLLLLSAFLLGSATIHAQTLTDVTSSYLQNAGFESDEASSNLESGTTAPTSWTMANTNNSTGYTQYGVASASTTIQGIGTSFSPSEGSNYFYIRCNWQKNNTFTLSQDVALPAGTYRISVQYATYDNTEDDPVYSLDVAENGTVKGSGFIGVNTGAWGTAYLYVTKTTDENTALTISASMTQKSDGGSQHVALLLDDVKIETVAMDESYSSTGTDYLIGTFEDCTAATASVLGSGSASETGATNGEWTYKTSAKWSCSAVVAYGQTDVTVASVSAPSADNAGSTGNALGVSVGWSGTELWQQTEAVTLPAGKYILKYYGYNNNSSTTMISKVGFVATDGTEYLSGKSGFAYGNWDEDYVTFTLYEATEGRFQVGGTAIHVTSSSQAKVFFDNLTLYRNVTVAESESEALLATVPTGKMQATVQTALDEAKAALESDKTNFEKYCALAEAITAANTSIAAYTTLNEALTTYAAKAENLDEAGQAAYDVSSIQAAYDEGTYDDADAQAAAESVKPTYVAAVKAQTTDGADFTDAIENPSFETGDATGWTYNSGDDTRVAVGNAGGTYGTDGIDGIYLFNTWSWGSSNNLYIQQTVTSLPAGRYTLTTLVASDAGTAITVSAADQETNVTIAGAKTVFETATVTFLLTETTDVTIKVSTTSWLKTDNFQLTREGAAEESLTVTDAGMATYSSDYALDFSEVTGLTAYTATYDEGENMVTFHKVTGAVPAMTGLLLKADGSATVAVPACASADAVENNILVGNGSTSVTVAASTSEAANFTLKKQDAGVNFVLVTEDHTLAANKAYAHIEADFVSEGSTVKALSFTFDDDAATAITTIATGSEAGKTGTYNMAGQRVGDNYKGIVIVNGKKILRK